MAGTKTDKTGAKECQEGRGCSTSIREKMVSETLGRKSCSSDPAEPVSPASHTGGRAGFSSPLAVVAAYWQQLVSHLAAATVRLGPGNLTGSARRLGKTDTNKVKLG